MSLSAVKGDDKRKINEQRNSLSMAIYFLSLSTFRWPFSLILACFVGPWKGRIMQVQKDNTSVNARVIIPLPASPV